MTVRDWDLPAISRLRTTIGSSAFEGAISQACETGLLSSGLSERLRQRRHRLRAARSLGHRLQSVTSSSRRRTRAGRCPNRSVGWWRTRYFTPDLGSPAAGSLQQHRQRALHDRLRRRTGLGDARSGRWRDDRRGNALRSLASDRRTPESAASSGQGADEIMSDYSPWPAAVRAEGRRFPST